jgi:hypothetical protein
MPASATRSGVQPLVPPAPPLVPGAVRPVTAPPPPALAVAASRDSLSDGRGRRAGRRQQESVVQLERHYGMDWLRIGAFGLLILYHVGMVFVPWGYHVKTEQPRNGSCCRCWRPTPGGMPLLFGVSGSRARCCWRGRPGNRPVPRRARARLLLPLVFGIIVIAAAANLGSS